MNIVKAELRRLAKSLAGWFLTLAALDIMFMAFFPSMKSSGMSALMKAKIGAIPQTLRDSLGIGSYTDFSDLLQYFAYCWQYILIAICLFAAITGANCLIKEESEGTIEFLYSKPASRLKIAVCKLISTFSALFVLSAAMFAVNAVTLFVLKSPGYHFMGGLLKITLTSFYGSCAFFAAGFLASTLLRRVSQASPCAMGIFFVSYIFGIFAPVLKDQKFMKYFSPYHYVLPFDILKNGSLSTSYAVILAVIIFTCIISGIAIYRKKDFRLS